MRIYLYIYIYANTYEYIYITLQRLISNRDMSNFCINYEFQVISTFYTLMCDVKGDNVVN